jgi:hypothetical protein
MEMAMQGIRCEGPKVARRDDRRRRARGRALSALGGGRMNRLVREKVEAQVIDAAITLLADYQSPFSDRAVIRDAERRFAVSSELLERAGLTLTRAN